MTVLLRHCNTVHVTAETNALRGPLKQVHVHRDSDAIHAVGSIETVRVLVQV